jgi:hypothetical protein
MNVYFNNTLILLPRNDWINRFSGIHCIQYNLSAAEIQDKKIKRLIFLKKMYSLRVTTGTVVKMNKIDFLPGCIFNLIDVK